MTRTSLYAAATVALTLLGGCGAVRDDLPSPDLDAAPAPVSGPAGDATSMAPTCVEGSWCWESPRPQGDALDSVWLDTATDGWAAGGHGALLRLGAAGWSLQPQPTVMDITGLWGSGASDVWAVATPNSDSGSTERGAILHWDGSVWQLMKPGMTYYSWLGGSSAEDVWALSWDDGPTTALHWDGTSWSAATAPAANYTIGALCVRGINDVWATAADQNVGSDPTAILHWDGTSWTQSFSLPEEFQRFDDGLACGLGTDVWAPYYDYNAQAYSGVYWDGNGWQSLPLPAPIAAGWADVDRLRVTHDGSFVVFDYSAMGSIYRWNAGSWQTLSPVSASPSSAGLVGASAYADIDFAPGGTGWLVTPAGDLVPWSGTSWDTRGLTWRDGIVGLDGTPGGPPTFAVGQAGYVGRRTASASGAAWAFAAPARAPSRPVGPSWVAGPDDLWVATAGAASHTEGGTTTSYALSTTEEIVAFGGTSSTNVWAIDTGGLVSRWDGTRWSAYAPSFPQTVGGSGPPLNPVGIWVAGPAEAWVAANGRTTVPCGSAATPPAIVHWNGSAWSAQWLGASGSVAAVGGTSATEVWVVGTSLWRLGEGATWAPVPQVGPLAAQALQVTAQGVYWLGNTTSAGESVARWDATASELTTWTIPVSDNVSIQALWVGARTAGGRDTIWVAGSNEGVLALEP